MKTRYRWPHYLGSLLVSCSLCLSWAWAAPPEVVHLHFGIVPQQSVTVLASLWTPLLAYLSERTGYDLQFATAKDIPTFEARLAAGEYDLAYMNPYHYSVFHRQPGYQVFAKEKDRKLQGVVVVRKDSPVQAIAELAGKTLAFPAPAAFAATVLPLAQFQEAGISVTPRYVASHDSVYLAVAKGLYPAGGGVQRTLGNTDPAVRDNLRVLWSTRPYTPHAFAAHPRIESGVVASLLAVMVAATEDPAGRERLAALDIKGLSGAVDSEYDEVRNLPIDVLKHLLDSP